MALWVNPPNAAGPTNGSTANSSMFTNQQTNQLVCDNFGFTLPPSAQIIGFQVKMVRGMDTGDDFEAIDRSVKLRAGTTLSANKASGGLIPGFPNTADFPFPPTNTDRWDLQNVTPTDVNNPNFSVLYQAAKVRSGGTSTVKVDSVQVIVTYIP